MLCIKASASGTLSNRHGSVIPGPAGRVRLDLTSYIESLPGKGDVSTPLNGLT